MKRLKKERELNENFTVGQREKKGSKWRTKTMEQIKTHFGHVASAFGFGFTFAFVLCLYTTNWPVFDSYRHFTIAVGVIGNSIDKTFTNIRFNCIFCLIKLLTGHLNCVWIVERMEILCFWLSVNNWVNGMKSWRWIGKNRVEKIWFNRHWFTLFHLF